MNKFLINIRVCLFLSIISPTCLALNNEAETIFTTIYEQNAWGSKESVSGPGSTLKETQKIRQEIPKLLKSYKVKVFLDAPCGDFNWLQHVDLSALDHYIGIDIVDDLITKNQSHFTDLKKSFFHANILTDVLPKADLIMCRDCLVHFPYEEIWTALRNFKSSGARYLLTTTFPGCLVNKDIPKVGGWRPLNLEISPFNFPKPLALITEEIKYTNIVYITKSLALWKLEDLHEVQ
ncbi:MAG: class I SAM-dependent methyltransferase [Candidatus Babeliales bacterium]